MKKNVMMRLACFLLVAVLISTSAISGTYAKYVTSGESHDQARVAKFGVTITGDNGMFHDAYLDEWVPYEVDETKTEITVQSGTENDDVVAPGTKGTLANFAVTGKPEVDVQVTYAPNLTLTNWYVDHDDDDTTPAITYCPIIITVNTEKFFIDGSTIKDTAELEAKVEAAIVAKEAYYHTNTDLTAVNDDLSVSWEWKFDETDHAGYQWNELDTKLGDAAADGDAAVIKLDIVMTVTQVN